MMWCDDVCDVVMCVMIVMCVMMMMCAMCCNFDCVGCGCVVCVLFEFVYWWYVIWS